MTFLSYFKKHSVLAGAALAVVVFVTVIGVRIAGQRTAGDNTTSNVRQVTVSDVSSFRADRATITADGTVESLEQADLKSQVSAPVSRIAVRIGDKVTAGQTLVLFQNGDFVAQLAQAQAGLAAQTARLQEMKKGARAEDLNISQTQYEQAKQALTDTYANLVNGVNDAYAKAEDIVRKQLDSMFTNGEYQPHLNFTTSLSQNQLNAENQRLAASTELNAWKKELLMVTASSPAGDLDTALTNAKNHLNTIRTLTNAMMDALNSAVGVQQGTLDGYKATVTGARAALSGAISSVNGLQQTVNEQKLAVDQAASALALKKEGATPESIASQEAAVQQAAASVQNLEVQLGKTSIRAPFSGTVASIPVRVGELVLPGQTIVSIVNIKGLQVKAYVSEEDMPRIEEGADVVIGSDGTKGKVARIAPSIDSATRKIEVDVPITENGSTSPIVGTNVTISIAAKSLTNTAGPVYHLPLQAIKVTDGGGYVYTVSSDSLVEEHKVAIGSVSGEYVEVISGIDDGMKLVIPVYELKAGEKVAATVTSSN